MNSDGSGYITITRYGPTIIFDVTYWVANLDQVASLAHKLALGDKLRGLRWTRLMKAKADERLNWLESRSQMVDVKSLPFKLLTDALYYQGAVWSKTPAVPKSVIVPYIRRTSRLVNEYRSTPDQKIFEELELRATKLAAKLVNSGLLPRS